jgi:outer membrane protein assembly factor BamB
MKVKTLGSLTLVMLAAALTVAQQVPSYAGRQLNVSSGSVDWAQFNFDAAHDGYNPYETILSPGTVGNVVLQWSYSSYDGTVEGAPAVANGIVYFATANGFLYTDFYMYALKADTGALVWSYAMSAPSFGSPAVENGVLYVVAGHVYALDANTGALVWQSQDNNCQYAPTLVNGVVYVVCDSNVVYALNVADGTTIWQYSTKGKIYAAPTVANDALYVNSGDGNVYALKAETGAVIWQKQFGASLSPPASLRAYGSGQAVANGLLYLGLRNHFYALDANTGSIIWKRDGFLVAFNTPAVGKGMVFLPTTNPICALDAETGATLWQYQLPDGASASTLVLANGVLYTAVIQGIGGGQGSYKLTAIDASVGQRLWEYDSFISFPLSGPGPAVVNGTIYSHLSTGFSAFGLSDQ